MSNADDIEFTWVDSTSVFDSIVKELLECDRYAIDTEFHRERTYFPALALVQLGWGDGNIALVDPLAVDLAPSRNCLSLMLRPCSTRHSKISMY